MKQNLTQLGCTAAWYMAQHIGCQVSLKFPMFIQLRRINSINFGVEPRQILNIHVIERRLREALFKLDVAYRTKNVNVAVASPSGTAWMVGMCLLVDACVGRRYTAQHENSRQIHDNDIRRFITWLTQHIITPQSPLFDLFFSQMTTTNPTNSLTVSITRTITCSPADLVSWAVEVFSPSWFLPVQPAAASEWTLSMNLHKQHWLSLTVPSTAKHHYWQQNDHFWLIYRNRTAISFNSNFRLNISENPTKNLNETISHMDEWVVS